MNDAKMYNDIHGVIVDYSMHLETKYGRNLSGSPTWTDVLTDFYRQDPQNPEFKLAQLLVDCFKQLTAVMQSDQDRFSRFMNEVR